MQNLQLQFTESEISFLQTLLPKGYSFQPVNIQTKRQRSAKKLDESFTNDYQLTPQNRQNHSQKSAKNTPIKAKLTSIEELPLEVKEVLDQPTNPSKINVGKQSKSENSLIWKQNEGCLNIIVLTKILQKLKNNKNSWPFRMPVNPEVQGVPNYLTIVKEPMDLKTMQKKLKSGIYTCDSQFHCDIKKIISNSYLFNPKDTVYYTHTKEFQAYYSKVCQLFMQNGSNIAENTINNKNGDFYENKIDQGKQIQRNDVIGCKKNEKRDIHSIVNTINESNDKRLITKSNASNTTLPSKSKLLSNQMTVKQRQRLFNQIEQLSQQQLKVLLSIVLDSSSHANWQQIQIEFKDMSDDKFKRIQTYLKDR